jgi:5-methylcytosine-specific restriction endonuclease McrA
MTRSEYQAYINSEAWQERKRAFLMTHGSCEHCRISAEAAPAIYDQKLHVHHRNYARVGKELDSDLKALCRRCHELEHNGKSRLPPSNEVRRIVRRLIGPSCGDTRMTEDGLAGLFS